MWARLDPASVSAQYSIDQSDRKGKGEPGAVEVDQPVSEDDGAEIHNEDLQRVSIEGVHADGAQRFVVDTVHRAKESRDAMQSAVTNIEHDLLDHNQHQHLDYLAAIFFFFRERHATLHRQQSGGQDTADIERREQDVFATDTGMVEVPLHGIVDRNSKPVGKRTDQSSSHWQVIALEETLCGIVARPKV